MNKTEEEIIITDQGCPVLKIISYSDDTDSENAEKILKSLRNSVTKYDKPTDPVDVEDWEALK